jgi:hypothetical protein
MHVSEKQRAQFAKHLVIGQVLDAAAFHLVPPDEEVSHALIGMDVNGPVGRQPCAVIIEVDRCTRDPVGTLVNETADKW